MSPVQGLEYIFLDAAHKGDLSKVKDLLEQGCPVNAQNKVSTTVELFQNSTLSGRHVHNYSYIQCFDFQLYLNA